MATPAPIHEPPYYAVIFTSTRTDGDHGYGDRADEMLELAAKQPGYLGVDSVRDATGLGVTVSYWRDEESIAAWRDNARHARTRADGRAEWYEEFRVHVARVERSYAFTR
jgi:heme-degrading monooxygenase HmoA